MKLKVVAGICLLLSALIYSCQSDEALEFDRYYSSGALVYQSHCQNCHGDKGQGLGALIPPLTDSVFLKTIRHQMACVVKNGLNNKIKMTAQDYDSKMPPVDLTPIEIAEVLTYTGNSFGNKMGLFNGDAVEVDLAKCGQ